MQKSALSLPLIVIGFAVLTLPLVIAVVNGLISPRAFGIAVLLLMGGLFVVLFSRLKRLRRIATEQGGQIGVADASVYAEALRKLRMWIVILQILLILGMWEFRGEPLGPRLVGAAISLSFTARVLFLFYKIKRKAVAEEALGLNNE